MSKASDPRYSTTDSQPPAPGLENASAPQPAKDNGQHGAYWVLSAEERAKGFVRPVRRSYKHRTCGSVTTMSLAIAETYAREPDFYGATFCVACGGHFLVHEFAWEPDGGVLGS